jgi:hypothetical protein
MPIMLQKAMDRAVLAFFAVLYSIAVSLLKHRKS